MIPVVDKSIGYLFSIEKKHRNHAAMGPKHNHTNISENEIKNAIETIATLTLSGGVIEKRLSSEEENFLKQTVENKEYNVYRGLALMKFRVTKEQYDAAINLKVGDVAPDFL